MDEHASDAAFEGGLSPDLTPEHLARLAAERPDLWDQIESHPRVYPDLRQWIADRRAESQAPQPPSLPAGPVAPVAPVAPIESATFAAAPVGAAPPGPAPFDSTAVASAPRRRRTTAIIAAVAAVALVLGGGTAALAFTETWPFGADGPLGGGSSDAQTAADVEKVSFAGGIEEAWTVESADVGGGSFGVGGWGGTGYPVGFRVEGPTHWYPKSFDGGVLARVSDATSDPSYKLVLLSEEDGSLVWEEALGSGEPGPGGCEVGPAGDRVYCLMNTGGGSELLVIGESGEEKRVSFDDPAADLLVDDSGVVVVTSATAARFDPKGKRLWESELGLAETDWAQADSAEGRVLVRKVNFGENKDPSVGGWAFFDARGKRVAAAEGTEYDERDVPSLRCDAAIAGQRLFLFGDCDEDVAPAGVKTTELAGIPYNRAVLGASDALVLAGDDGVTAYDAAGGGELWNAPGKSLFHFSSAPVPEPLLLTPDHGTSGSDWTPVAVDGETGAELFEADGLKPGGARVLPGAIVGSSTDTALGLIGVDPESGDALWRQDLPADSYIMHDGTGVVTVQQATSRAESDALTFYRPVESAGGDAETAQAASVTIPDSIPYDCPADTILLAWAELPDGWVLVCGITLDEPTFVAYQPSAKAKVVFSNGAKQPTGADAQASVNWDAKTKRYTAELAGGDKLTLDYDLGTLTVRDEADAKTLEQQRTARYIFLVIGERVRTVDDTSEGDGAFSVQKPKDTAEDQIRYMIQVLEKAYDGRALVKDALPKLQYCTASAGGYTDTIAAMKAVRDNRAELLEALDSMPVDKIPEGEALLDDLTEAIRTSHSANVEYVAWAEAANKSGCASLSAAGQAAAAASDAPKERFAARWNRAVAPVHGVRTFDAWYI